MEGKNYLNIFFINVRMQTGFSSVKQAEIEIMAKRFGMDVIHMQEVHITEETFSQCTFTQNNYNIVFNNNRTKNGTASLVKTDLDISNVAMDNNGRVIIFDICEHTQVNLYLPAGSDAENKNRREEYFSLTLPQLLQNRRNCGIVGGDFNCIVDAIDSSNNPDLKISKGLKRLSWG